MEDIFSRPNKPEILGLKKHSGKLLARWSFIMDNAKDEKIGQYIDDAMILIEKENTSLKGVKYSITERLRKNGAREV